MVVANASAPVPERRADSPPARQGRLFRKYFLLMLALVCGVLLVSGGINRYFYHQHNTLTLASLQHEKAVAAADKIERLVLSQQGRRDTPPSPQPNAGTAPLGDDHLSAVLDVVRGIKLGSQGKAYIVDRSGHLVILPGISGSAAADVSALPQVQSALAGNSFSAERATILRDPTGIEVLTTFATIQPTGWKLVVEQPAADINPAFNATLLSTGTLMLAGLLISTVSSLWLARSLVEPIRTLQRGAQRIGAGELDLRISVQTGDELESLADQFNEMAQRLRESHADLERKVADRTREIEDKSRQLEMADKHKSEFLASMSHELRTPLNAIIGFSDVLLEQMFGELNPKQLEYLRDIHASGQHLLSLINDILDLAKVEAGRMELNLGIFDVRAAIDNALTLVRERALRQGITLTSEVDPQLCELRADERKLKQILLNLLSNAVKFTPQGGAIKVMARQRDDSIEIAVADTGVGIARVDQDSVFEEFKQIGGDYARKSEGTGLGLALTRKLVELHGGSIGLESEPGSGSTFTIVLPADAKPA